MYLQIMLNAAQRCHECVYVAGEGAGKSSLIHSFKQLIQEWRKWLVDFGTTYYYTNLAISAIESYAKNSESNILVCS